jgi:hypothetical protein
VNKNVKIAEILPKHSFWDMKVEQLDAQRDIAVIVPRALFFTTPETFEKDIELLEKIYNKSEIVRNLKATKEPISNKIFELVANRYHVATFRRFVVPQNATRRK